MTDKEQQFNQWFDQYANGVKVFEEADMKQAYLQGRAELEKENAELRAKESFVGEQNQKLCDQQLRIEVLEKENAELKGLKDIASLIRANNDTVITLMQLNNMLVSKSQQLTKAKEHIKRLLDCLKQDPSDPETNYYIGQYMDKAEQFIKE